MSIFDLLIGRFRKKNEKANSRKKETRRERKQRVKTNKTALVVFDATFDNPFTSFRLETWMDITTYLKCGDVMNLRLASLGIPGGVTLNPALTSHLNLNLDNCPWPAWVWKKRIGDHDQLARNWCHRKGVIDFPQDITNDELAIFISKDYLRRATKVSFGRCRQLTVVWFELLRELKHVDCEVGLPPYITNEELSRSIPYLQHATRLNCVGCSQLTNEGFNRLGMLKDLKELYFLHCKQLTSLTFLGNLDGLQKLSIDGMLNTPSRKSKPVVNDSVLAIMSGELNSLQSLVIATQLDLSGIGLLHMGHMRKLESLDLERGAGENLTDNGLKVLCGLGRLRSLRITHCEKLSDRSLNYLQHLHRLENLELTCWDHSNFTDEGARQLSKHQSLKHLTLSGWENLTDRGMHYLSNIKSLERLNIRHANQITDVGVDNLSRLKGLRNLELTDCSVTYRAKSHLTRETGAIVSVW